ncbi:MAG: dockerin type I domain-containing protein [Planctomycetota bacterium]
MKAKLYVAVIAILVVSISSMANAQSKNKKFRILPAKPMQLFGLDGQPIQSPLSPVEDETYGNQYTWVLENPVDGADVARGLSFQGDFADSIMDGEAQVLGGDFADFVDDTFDQNSLSTNELLEFVGVDGATGRNILKLTVEFFTDANLDSGPQWDSFDMDLRDPLDADMNGETGAGPDGIFGTADDVVEPDGIFDTGDGVLDAAMPMDPPGLVVFAIDNDGDGDPTNDLPSNPVSLSYLVGGFFGSPEILFDPAAGPRTPVQALFFIEDFNGEFIDIDRNGIADEGADSDRNGDGVLDSIRVDTIVALPEDVLGGTGWTGTYGLFFGNDGSGLTTDEFMSGTMAKIGYEIQYLSDVKNEFGGGPGILCGDVNLDGVVDLLDVAPFVELITNNEFQAEADINGDGEVDLLDVAPFVAKLVG